MDENTKRALLCKYFEKPSGCGWWLLGIGAVVFLIGLSIGSDGLAVTIIGLLAAVVGGLWRYSESKGGDVVSDSQVDAWLDEDIRALVPGALNKSGLTQAELVGEPLIVRGPIYWTVTGIFDTDLKYKKGEDGYARFSVYDVTIVFLTEERLSAYRCDFNFLKCVALNEATTEYFYQDVVSVSTREVSTSYTLPNKQSLVSAQAFSIQVPSGDAIKVVVSATKLQQITGAQLPPTGAEKAVDVIRTMLRSKKGVVRVAKE